MHLNLRIPAMFHRDYRQDIDHHSKSWEVRITKVALPFLALYPPLVRPVALATSSLRIYKAPNLPNQLIAICAAVAFIFYPAAGFAITTLQDCANNVIQIYGALHNEQARMAVVEIINLANNILYLSTMVSSQMGLQLASMTFQIIVGGIYCTHEFNKGKWLEGGSCALLTSLYFRDGLTMAKEFKESLQLIENSDP